MIHVGNPGFCRGRAYVGRRVNEEPTVDNVGGSRGF